MKTLTGDFHTHMNGNGRANRKINIDFICSTAINFGYNSVFIGCHDYVGIEFKNYVEDIYNLIAICGAEITTTVGHLLVYNIDKIPNNCYANNKNPLDIDKAIYEFKVLGGKLVIAHPYENNRWATEMNGLERIIHKLDGAEITNLKSYLRDGIKEFSWIKKWKHLKLFRNSDCHPWEGDNMNIQYSTKINMDWFGV